MTRIDVQPLGMTSVALVLLTALLWGGTPVAISYSVDTLPPIAVAAVRFAMAAVFMLFWCRFDGSGLRLRAGQLRPVMVAGVLLFVQISLFNVGIWLSSSSHATMLINTFIFWVVALEHFVTRTDRLTTRRVTGLVIAAAGTMVVFFSAGTMVDETSRDPPSLAGDAILLCSALLLGIKIVYIKEALRTVESGKLIFWHDVIGVGLFAAYSFALEETTITDFDTPAILGLVYQGVLVAGFCFAVQTHLLRRHSASQISVFSFSTPLFGVALSYLFRGDRISSWVLLSAACVAVGILMVNRKGKSVTGGSDF